MILRVISIKSYLAAAALLACSSSPASKSRFLASEPAAELNERSRAPAAAEATPRTPPPALPTRAARAPGAPSNSRPPTTHPVIDYLICIHVAYIPEQYFIESLKKCNFFLFS